MALKSGHLCYSLFFPYRNIHHSDTNVFVVHSNYIGLDAKKEPYALSVCLTAADNHGIPQYRAILWKASVSSLI